MYNPIIRNTKRIEMKTQVLPLEMCEYDKRNRRLKVASEFFW